MKVFLIGGFIPFSYAAATTGGTAWLSVLTILVLAIAVVVELVDAATPSPVRPASKELPAPRPVLPKAA